MTLYDIEGYQSFWTSEAAKQTITPRNLRWPEGFDPRPVLGELIGDAIAVCEVGCGDGRLQAMADYYCGVDVNKENLPKTLHFKHIGFDERYPVTGAYVFYTVMLHMPDDYLNTAIHNCNGRPIIVAEIMNEKYRGRTPYSHHRSLETYREIFSGAGYECVKAFTMPYEYYPNEVITFAKFQKGKADG